MNICQSPMKKIKDSRLLQPYIYNLIQEEIERMKESGRSPVVASHNVIMCAVNDAARQTLKELEADGLISSYENVNKIPMYKLVERK